MHPGGHPDGVCSGDDALRLPNASLWIVVGCPEVVLRGSFLHWNVAHLHRRIGTRTNEHGGRVSCSITIFLNRD